MGANCVRPKKAVPKMCGRFALATEKHILEMLFELELREELSPRFNIAPSERILALRINPSRGGKEFVRLQWGLVPAWAGDESISRKLINARSETAAVKPAFREAFSRRRLLIPASGFYEWRREGRAGQPYYIRLKSGRPFLLGGLWESRRRGESALESCAILTTPANSLVAPLHDRMPLIIAAGEAGRWLDPRTAPAELSRLLLPFPAEEMIAYPVSRLVNNPANDCPACLEPLQV